MIMYMKVNIANLRNDLAKYLNEVKAGREVIVTDHNEPVAKIVPLLPAQKSIDVSNWFKDHPPVRTKKRIEWVKSIGEMRDEE